MKKVKYRDINNNVGEVDVDKLFFRPSVYGVLIEGDKILLSPQWDGYDFPGGGMEIYETVEQALEREFWEETGLKVKRREIVVCESNFFKLPYGGNEGQYCNSIAMYYLCERIGGELSTGNFDEHEKEYAKMPKWVDLKNIEKIKFYTSVDNIDIINKVMNILNK
jgi:8-oxo-dGTP pyrophosphatase MutT (NUDIX family)